MAVPESFTLSDFGLEPEGVLDPRFDLKGELSPIGRTLRAGSSDTTGDTNIGFTSYTCPFGSRQPVYTILSIRELRLKKLTGRRHLVGLLAVTDRFKYRHTGRPRHFYVSIDSPDTGKCEPRNPQDEENANGTRNARQAAGTARHKSMDAKISRGAAKGRTP